jgi:aryl-phospho-beta-D-glucosidase BglC (GH1 family)
MHLPNQETDFDKNPMKYSCRPKSFVFIFLSLTSMGYAQIRQPAFDMNDRLGRGINMGNAFEAPSEDAWGNPWQPEYFEIIAGLGFDHVRLPIRWEPVARSMEVSPYTIDPTFLARIKEVVDKALEEKLHIIINMHHHEALYEDPPGQKARFLSQWRQIADYFSDYPDSLLFEVLNEPHGNLTPQLWNEYFNDALNEIRTSNPTRTVLMGVADYGGLGGIVHLEIPDDDYLILTPHYYNPFSFTHQGAEWVGGNADDWLGTEWLDTETDRETVKSEFAFAIQFSEENSIPIHIGEFGAYSKADLDSRVRWTTYLARWFEEQGFSWAYWEFSAGFGIYDPSTEQLLNPLTDALLHNEMPDPIPVNTTLIYSSNFASDTDGWILQTHSGAAGSLSISDAGLNVSITLGGSETWHVQLVRNNFLLEREEMYKISFTASAEKSRSVTFYAGKASDPWNAYSGYNNISLTEEVMDYQIAFTMNDPTAPAARMVFDLGNSDVNINVTDFKLELLSIKNTITGDEDDFMEKSISIFPNPAKSVLNIPKMDSFKNVRLTDLQGRIVISEQIKPGMQSLEVHSLKAGVYMLVLSNEFQKSTFRIFKK